MYQILVHFVQKFRTLIFLIQQEKKFNFALCKMTTNNYETTFFIITSDFFLSVDIG